LNKTGQKKFSHPLTAEKTRDMRLAKTPKAPPRNSLT